MTEKQILAGIPKIIDNSKSIYREALFLLRNQYNERAYSLFQLAIEELGKAIILMNAILFEDITVKEKQRKLLRDISDHETKTKKSFAIDSLLTDLIKKIDQNKYVEISEKLIKELGSVKLLNKKKNDGFYVSFTGNGFQSPNEVIIEKDVMEIKHKASLRISLGEKLLMGIVLNYETIKTQIVDFDLNNINT